MTKARDLADLGNKTSLDEINDAYDAGALSNRNLIINGAMQVAQRGTSFTHTNVGAGSFYCLDRFTMQSDLPAMAYTVTQAQDGPSGTGLVNSFKITVNTPASSFPDNANRYFRVRHKIEAQNIQHLVNKPCTLSFWVKSSITGQFDATAFALDISGNNHFVAPYTINTANTWEKKEIYLTGPAVIDNNNEAGLDIQFQIAKSGTGYQTSSTGVWGSTKLSSTGSTSAVATTANATWQVTGVQLEVGDTATPYEHKNARQELSDCQRYCWQLTRENSSESLIAVGFVYSTSSVITHLSYPQVMRAIPSASVSSVSHFQVLASGGGWQTLSSINYGLLKNSGRIFCGISNAYTTGTGSELRITAGHLLFDAEL
jgi:hypothetical protein